MNKVVVVVVVANEAKMVEMGNCAVGMRNAILRNYLNKTPLIFSRSSPRFRLCSPKIRKKSHLN